MTAQIIAFPTRKPDAERLALLASNIDAAIPLPKVDPELDLLLQIGAKLIDNLNDYTRPDCRGLIDDQLDAFLVRLDKWDARSA